MLGQADGSQQWADCGTRGFAARSAYDYGLFGPLFAHLGRAPVPFDLMKRRAPRVFRWIERMNARDPDIPEYGDYPAAYLDDNAVPDTLASLSRQMAQELPPS